MQVIKDKEILNDDWHRVKELDASQELPEGRIIFPFDYWLANREKLIDSGKKYAVCVNGDHETEDIARDMEYFEMIVLDFPVFTDGRSYSHARILRDRYEYRGELRAVGDVLRDQLFYMHRCGIDSFQIREDKDIKDALNAFTELSVRYQTAADKAPPIYKLR